MAQHRVAVRRDGYMVFDNRSFPQAVPSGVVQHGDDVFAGIPCPSKRVKNRDELLRETIQQFRIFVELLPEAVVVLDADTARFVDGNQSALRLFGLSREQFLKVGPVEMSPRLQPDKRSSAEAAWEKIQQALNGEQPVFEWIHRNASNNPIPCEVRLKRLPSGTHRLICARLVDLREHQRVQRQLQQ